MRKYILVFFVTICGLLISSRGLYAQQVISSPKANILIKNDIQEIDENDLHTPLPVAIIYPSFTNSRSRIFTTDASQINIIGRLNNVGNTNSVYINDEKVDFSGEGLFFRIVSLSPGDNNLSIKVIQSTGKVIIVRFIVDYRVED